MRVAPEERSGPPSIRLRAGGRDVIFPAAAVRQVLQAGAVMRVPLTRPAVAGVVAREGRAIPIYYLAVLVGADGPGSTVAGVAGEIVVVEMDGALAGLLVERAESSRGRPAQGDAIMDGLTLLSSAGLFHGGRGDQQAAQAAEGAL